MRYWRHQQHGVSSPCPNLVPTMLIGIGGGLVELRSVSDLGIIFVYVWFRCRSAEWMTMVYVLVLWPYLRSAMLRQFWLRWEASEVRHPSSCCRASFLTFFFVMAMVLITLLSSSRGHPHFVVVLFSSKRIWASILWHRLLLRHTNLILSLLSSTSFDFDRRLCRCCIYNGALIWECFRDLEVARAFVHDTTSMSVGGSRYRYPWFSFSYIRMVLQGFNNFAWPRSSWKKKHESWFPFKFDDPIFVSEIPL